MTDDEPSAVEQTAVTVFMLVILLASLYLIARVYGLGPLTAVGS